MAMAKPISEDCSVMVLPDQQESDKIQWVANFGLSTQSRSFTESLALIRKHIPVISDARKQKTIALYQKWGSYGWTPDPDDAMRELFKTEPLSKSDADNRARTLFRDMAAVFEALRKCKRAKQSDLEEAIDNFNGKRYKSCAMLLFALIDAQLIRLQNTKANNGPRRKVGAEAVRKARKKSGVDEHDEWLILAMDYNNLFYCLDKMFENGNDFRRQPEIINRNFLAHGMMQREVTRTNCIQLFLAYYNTIGMVDLVYFKPFL